MLNDRASLVISIVPLGDMAVLLTFADESAAAQFAAAARAANEIAWLDVVPAYTSVAIHFDPDRTNGDAVALRARMLGATPQTIPARQTHVIPCCYEMGEDLQRVADVTGLSCDDVIRLHVATAYTVYAIGFCPGFPYLGYLPAELQGVPRLDRPRLRVEPGSVGLTGRQTGVYPLARPGGWNLIGRTPLEIVHVADGYFPLRVGDQVCFERIDERVFDLRRGQRIAGS